MAQKKQKRENLERTERTQERTKPLFPPTFQALSKYYWRELLHLSSAVDQKAQRGVSDDYRKILQRDFAAIPRIHNQRPDVPYLSYQQKDLLPMNFSPMRTWKKSLISKGGFLFMKLFKKNENKETVKLPMSGKVKKGFRFYCVAVMAKNTIKCCLIK